MKYKITYAYDVEVMVEAPNKAVALDIAADVAVAPSFSDAPGVIYATAEFTDMTDIECMDDEDPPRNALESWSFANNATLPGYLSERLNENIQLLSSEVLR